MLPLADIEVLDFSTLLPGPLATLILAEAGANVTKVERPGRGDEMRSYVPQLRRRERQLRAAQSRQAQHRDRSQGRRTRATSCAPLLERADVLVEQFRPGVMDRLGLGYEALSAINPGIVYCSLTGYGQDGPRAGTAAHDLNYVADTGLLDLWRGRRRAGAAARAGRRHRRRRLPGGDQRPARARRADAHRQGAHLDVAMADNVFPFLYWAMGTGSAAGRWPRRGADLSRAARRATVYRTADDRFVAAAPLEERFWAAFCELVEVDEALRDDARDPAADRRGDRERIAAHPAGTGGALRGRTSAARSSERAGGVDDEHFRARGIFARRVSDGGGAAIPALPVPVADAFRRPEDELGFPALGEREAV